MSVDRSRQPGDALAAALGMAEGQPGVADGRSLLLALIRLHELGALIFDDGLAAVHRARPSGEPGPVVRCDEAKPRETAPAYNMGSLSASDSDPE